MFFILSACNGKNMCLLVSIKGHWCVEPLAVSGLFLPRDPCGDLSAVPGWHWHVAAPWLPLSLPYEMAGHRLVGLESLCGGLGLLGGCFSAGFGIAAFPCLLQAAVGGSSGRPMNASSLQGQHGGMLQRGEGFGGAGGKRGLAMSCGTPDDAGSGGFEGAQRQQSPAWLFFLFCFF